MGDHRYRHGAVTTDSPMKQDLLRLLTREPIVPLFRPFQRGAVTIFMLHRFADSAYGNDGHSAERLRANLGFLRRHRFRVIGLPQLLEELDQERLPAAPTVVFTVDDGYGDFARVAAPVFAEFDCPVTVFVTTAFIDGGFWMWFDKIAWAFSESRRRSIRIEVPGASYRYSLEGTGARVSAVNDLIEKLKRVPDPVAQGAVDELLRVCEVRLPLVIPDRYAPMTWGDVARCARQGVTFGPHTVTHPILSQVEDERSRAELEDSWRRLCASSSAAIPVFCYPNGDYASFTDRERRTLASMGMRAAVLAEERFTTSRDAQPKCAPFALELPRYPYPDNPTEFRQIVGGMERLKLTLRSVLNPSPRIPAIPA
jgi:peptidoglycan/xylan/chitin deacetylase (PgdA/CDA1 family)